MGLQRVKLQYYVLVHYQNTLSCYMDSMVNNAAHTTYLPLFLLKISIHITYILPRHVAYPVLSLLAPWIAAYVYQRSERYVPLTVSRPHSHAPPVHGVTQFHWVNVRQGCHRFLLAVYLQWVWHHHFLCQSSVGHVPVEKLNGYTFLR